MRVIIIGTQDFTFSVITDNIIRHVTDRPNAVVARVDISTLTQDERNFDSRSESDSFAALAQFALNSDPGYERFVLVETGVQCVSPGFMTDYCGQGDYVISQAGERQNNGLNDCDSDQLRECTWVEY